MQHASNLVKALQCLARCSGRPAEARATATAQFGPQSGPVRILSKMAGSTSDIDSAELRAGYRELLGLSRRRSLIGKIDAVHGFRTVPFNTRVLEQQPDGNSAAFVGEGKPYAAGADLDLKDVSLERRKIGSIIPMTAELAKLFDASSAVSRDLVRGIAIAEGNIFFGTAAADDDAPAGVANGLTPETGSNDPEADVSKLADEFGGDLDQAVLITSPKNGVKLARLFGWTTGARGGEVAGIAHVTAKELPDSEAALLEPARILLADDGLEVRLSDQATLHQLDSGGEADGEGISLFQTDSIAWKLTRWINWRAAPGSVLFMNTLNW